VYYYKIVEEFPGIWQVKVYRKGYGKDTLVHKRSNFPDEAEAEKYAEDYMEAIGC
jgi:hypothetical protein